MRGCSRKHWKAVKKWVIEEHGPRCAYCRRKTSRSQATIDHIVPFSLGGTNHLDNLTLACADCNHLKGNMLPEEFQISMKFYVAKIVWIAAALRQHQANAAISHD